MNSAQIRKTKREFTHVITIVAETGWRYFEHDEKVMSASNWCSWHTKGGYRVVRKHDHAKFKFTTEKDAVIFALKWL